jgi:hypothetical protein
MPEQLPQSGQPASYSFPVPSFVGAMLGDCRRLPKTGFSPGERLCLVTAFTQIPVAPRFLGIPLADAGNNHDAVPLAATAT